jgi:quinohemoprotein ethanol dehydrogenase
VAVTAFQHRPGRAFWHRRRTRRLESASLLAWDPVNQKKVWEKPLPPNWNPGTMTTAGNLVFEGRADGLFVAYNATTGDEAVEGELGHGISAAPITYTVDGKQ